MITPCQIVVPGRVNLIGEHIDYHALAVLPIAIPRHITLTISEVTEGTLEVDSGELGIRTLRIDDDLELGAAGNWGNYMQAAVKAVRSRWPIHKAFHGSIRSNLPMAAGLSSSSALITALTLGLLRANNIRAQLSDLMDILPEGEHFVGTRGGGMDHAAVLASQTGYACLIRFSPFAMEHVPVPADWRFIVAHSLVRAEKSGAAKIRYNACRAAGDRALAKLGLTSYQAALKLPALPCLDALTQEERNAFMHVTSEAGRVGDAVRAMRTGSRREFGNLLNQSHASLRDLLQVSCSALDCIVEIANRAGADGARLTGAGFGGCALILCTQETQGAVMAALEADFYSAHSEYRRDQHLMTVTPANGALYASQD